METHVFAVWDFMSLTKRLQQEGVSYDVALRSVDVVAAAAQFVRHTLQTSRHSARWTEPGPD